VRLLAAAIVVTLGSAAWAGRVVMAVSGSAGWEGSAEVLTKRLDDGGKYVRLTLNLRHANGAKSDVVQESTYDASGEPVRFLQTSVAPGVPRSSTVVVFDALGAEVTTQRGEDRKTERVSKPDGVRTAARSELWFLATKPVPGAEVGFSRFVMAERAWKPETARYHGLREIVVGGKAVKAHLVTVGEAKAFVDDAGDPWRLETGGVVLERTERTDG
jgi:hypothetical protein